MKKEEILVIGNGFLGKQFAKNGYKVLNRQDMGGGLDVSTFGRKNFRFVEEALENHKCLVNCVGKSNTRWCEDPRNWEEMFSMNALLPKELSLMCRFMNKKFVQISTGCVYHIPYCYDSYNSLGECDRPVAKKETDFIESHCNYVVAKIAGENFCKPERDLIIRPRLYFSESEDRNNLLCKLPKFTKFLGNANTYTSCQTIVEATKALLENEQVGVFNVGQEGYLSLMQVANLLGLDGELIWEHHLHKSEKLFLVNNVMDMSKLKEFYQPRDIEEELLSCWNVLKKTYNESI